MEFKAQARTIEDAFNLKRKYVIPRFQREYSWEIEELEELWDDLIESIKDEKAHLYATEYFIGSLVLVGDDDDARNIERQVVDGQQRLITFTIAFAVLSQLFKGENEDKLSDMVHGYIIGEDENGIPYAKIKSETPKPFFQQRIQEKNIDFKQIPKSLEEKRILSTYKFIEKRLEQKALMKVFADKFPKAKTTYLDALKLFRDQILNCKVIYVTVKSFDDAYTIFEVLNAKGKDLTPVDIVKNSLFSVLTQKEPIDIAYEKWASIRRKMSEGTVDDIVVFYRHFWLSKYGFATGRKLVREFNSKVDKDIDSYTAFLDQLIIAASDYASITSPNARQWTQPEDRGVFETLEALDIFGVTQVRTFLLALFDVKRNGKIKHSKYLEVLKFLQYFHFVFNAVCSERASGLERRYSSYARKLREAECKESAAKCIRELISVLQANLPSYDEYEARFEGINYTSKASKSKRLVQYILRKLEIHFANSIELQPDSFSIEHILPESTEHPLLGKVGNLLPLGEGLNGKLANKSFVKKVTGYKKSQYRTVADFLDEYGDLEVWDEKNIIRRTKQIAKILYYQNNALKE